MSTANIIKIDSTSTESFEDAIRQAIANASRKVKNIKGAWVDQQTMTIENGRVNGYRVGVRVSFVSD